MLKSLIAAAVLLCCAAQVWALDVNRADEAELKSLKGLGASKAHAIVVEREAHGPFRDGEDLAARVKGLGVKSIARLREQGLEFGTAQAARAGKGARAPGKAQSGAAEKSSRPGKDASATATARKPRRGESGG